MRCAAKGVITEIAKYLADLGYTVSAPERVTRRGDHEGHWLTYVNTRDAAVRIIFDPKTCDYFIEDLAGGRIRLEDSIAAEVAEALRRVRP